MAEYIEKRLAKIAIRELPAELDALAVQRSIEAVGRVPAADVAPVVHARWERVPSVSGVITKVQCSACKGRENLGFEDRQFCPRCGAKMDLKNESEEK